MIDRVVIAGGGTGGHLFPGLAVVEELRRRNASLEVTFVGTEQGIESRVLPKLGERLETIRVSALKGKDAGGLLRSVGRLPGAASEAMALLRRHRPDVVIGVGGYASGPIVATAAALRIPTAVLEQNAHVGLTNRLLARLVGRAYVSFPNTASEFPPKKVRSSGNPLRRAFVRAARRALVDPAGFEARASTILVLGGSQGARVLNEVVPEALAQAFARGVRQSASSAQPGHEEWGPGDPHSPRGERLRVVHQTGSSMVGAVTARYRELGVDAEVTPFIDDMASAYANAALVIARAGATSVAEICAIGRASILVPYPHAADDHQAKNAETLASQGACVAIRENALDAATLATHVERLLRDTGARTSMAEAARKLGRPDAAAAIVDDLCAWLGCPDAPPPRDSDEPPIASASSAHESGLRSGSWAPRIRSRDRRSSLPPHTRSLYLRHEF
jgi:UDP-N-acetylglucosamine--N-acetylmuramyl-(pentapeptide) pyrophosphoryl-undecaprenol N-acetylglucosamine transferase